MNPDVSCQWGLELVLQWRCRFLTDCHDHAPVVPLVLRPMYDQFSTTRCLQNIDSFRVGFDPEETEQIIWPNTFIGVETEVVSFLCPPHFPPLQPSHLSAFPLETQS